MCIRDRDFTALSGFVQTFLATQEDTDGRYVELEIVLQPGAGGAPLHVHPNQEERLEIKAGVVEVFHSGRWHTLNAGDVAVVPPGMPDRFQNRTQSPRISPVLDFQDMNVAIMKLINEGKVKSQKDPKSIIYSAMVLKRFPKSLRMLNPTYRWTTSIFSTVGTILGWSID